MSKLFKQWISQKFDAKVNDPLSHTSLSDGKYFIPDDEKILSEFFEKYNIALQNNEKLHLVERHAEYGPIVIDLDFKFKKEKIKRLITDEHIKYVVKQYNKVIKKLLNITNDIQLESFIFQKQKPCAAGSYVKDGVHIMYPFICTSPSIQFIIRKEIVILFNNSQYFKAIDVINKYEDIFDKSVIQTNGWIMYGSSKPNLEPYKLTYIFDSNLDLVSLSKYDKNDLPRMLSIRYINKDNIVNVKDEHQHILNKMEEEMKKQQDKKKLNSSYTNKNKIVDDDEFNTIQQLINILNPERAEEYLSWLEVGWCLHNIDDRLLEKWIQFSEKSSKFKPGVCEKEWNKMKPCGKGIGSLYFWAKNDNLAQYNSIIQDKVNMYYNDLLTNAIKCSHYNIAEIVHRLYKYNFVCSSIKNKSWYQYNSKNHTWEISECGTDLRNILSTDISTKILNVSMFVSIKFNDTKNDKYSKGCQQCLELIKSLSSSPFKDNVMKECCEIFYDRKFDEKLNSNIYLIGFKNGVYDLDNGVFRDGCPDDFISFSTHINYIEYDENNEDIQYVKRLLRTIQPDDELYEYLLTSLASYIDGQIADEKLIIWTGTGSNGKSLLVSFFEEVFGDYCTKLPTSLLTRKRGASSAASPEVAKTLGKRFAVLQEPEQDDKINVGLMKEITGGDKIEARELYKNPVIFKPQFKLLLTCNDLPQIPSNDGGTWRRLRVLPFKSKFVDNPDPNDPLQFKKDPLLCEKLKKENIKEALMSLLIYYYNTKYKTGGLVEPAEVVKYTNEYQKVSDKYSDFIEEHIIDIDKTIDNPQEKKIKTKLCNIYCLFKEWYGDALPGEKAPPKKEFKEYFIQRFGKPLVGGGGYWTNIKLKNFDDDSLSD